MDRLGRHTQHRKRFPLFQLACATQRGTLIWPRVIGVLAIGGGNDRDGHTPHPQRCDQRTRAERFIVRMRCKHHRRL